MATNRQKEKAQIKYLSKFSDNLGRFSISRIERYNNSRISVHQRLARRGRR